MPRRAGHEWHEARSSLGDLERPDRAGALMPGRLPLRPARTQLLAPARLATRPQNHSAHGISELRPSADINWSAIDVSHTSRPTWMIS